MQNDDINEEEGITQSGLNHEQDAERYELSTDKTLLDMYHSWLGEVETVDGVYKRDPRLSKIMNEEFASICLGELKRINTNMHFSTLEQEDIIDMSTRVAELVVERLGYFFEEFDVKVENIESIGNQMLDNLTILLTNAKEGGMKDYKIARSQLKIIKHQTDQQQTAY